MTKRTNIIAFAIGALIGLTLTVRDLVKIHSLKKKLSNCDKEIRYMKDQVEDFRYELDLLKDGDYPYIVSTEDIIKLADDAFEWFEGEKLV